ncbi:MAG: GTP 3',8-cyclase MoaA [Pyrinomonadaceae bacterium]|nr:GTP 3',8-cyclase MoaA [Pyrinomonadaceae bacterium]
MKDSHNRKIKDLRVSLTDRCNFRCFYCLPNGEPAMAQKEKVLTYEELDYICEIFVELGIEKIRLTGGEPLLRRDVDVLVKKLSRLKNPKSKVQSPKLEDLALTTNGFLLDEKRAKSLKANGLDRVTISLDTLKRDNFTAITKVDAFDKVLNSIEAAKLANLSPIKINAVIVRGHNEDEIVDFAGFARENDLQMRFIEYMPLDSGHGWQREQVFSGRDIYEAIHAVFPLEPKAVKRGAETARRYVFADGANGEIGIIAPVTEPFCGACSRIRLTADGQIRTCLFSTKEHNLRDTVRNAENRQEVIEFIENVVYQKEPSHFIGNKEFITASRSMSFIGG